MENNIADMRMTPDKIRECPFCKNAPFYRVSEEMLDGNGEFEVLCLYNHCPISGIGIRMSVWQGATRTPPPERVTVEEVASTICKRLNDKIEAVVIAKALKAGG